MLKRINIKRLLVAILISAITLSNVQLKAEAKSYFNSESDIIKRTEWGANESYRYTKDNDSVPQLIQLDDDFKREYSSELKIIKTVKKDSSGQEYKWPYEYPKKVTKFIIHHTATTKDLDNPEQAIRNIYYYHAVSRGWGDIGYNYIIDQEGRVYEGRAGGDGVVGGHAGPGNVGSIGIAVLGNFDEQSLPEEVINSLAKLIAIKSEKFDIDPTKRSSFRGENQLNVMGHNDVMSTSCPGDNLDAKLSTIAKLAKSLMKKTSTKSNAPYAYIDRSDVSNLSLKTGEEKLVTVQFKNIGKKDWNENTYLTVKTDSQNDDFIEFPEKIGIRLPKASNGATPAGKTATFMFKVKAKDKPTNIYIDLAPVMDGRKKLSDYKTLPIEIAGPAPLTVVPTTTEKDPYKAYAMDPNKTVKQSDLTQEDGGKLRVKITFTDSPVLKSAEKLTIKDSNGKVLKTFSANTELSLSKSNNKYIATTNKDEYKSTDPIKLETANDGVIEIVNMDRKSTYDPSYNDNKFRGAIEYREIDGAKVTINELKLESYLKGLAEEMNSTPAEKIKSIIVAARSYAKFYMHYADKFPGKPYNIDDDPAVSQKYRGYGFESRAPNIVKAVDETKGEVITHNGQLVKAPYFSSDDGRTRSAYEVWKWNAPYLKSVDDSYCDGKSMAGHGVGMSGCGALGMAKDGKTYKEILKYYYTGIEITKLW